MTQREPRTAGPSAEVPVFPITQEVRLIATTAVAAGS